MDKKNTINKIVCFSAKMPSLIFFEENEDGTIKVINNKEQIERLVKESGYEGKFQLETDNLDELLNIVKSLEKFMKYVEYHKIDGRKRRKVKTYRVKRG